MTVYLIGAGPGAADLITLRGARILGRCQTALVAGSLVPDEILGLCAPDAHIIDTARMPLPKIISHISDAHAAGHDVARVHSGDLSLYSAVTEQVRHIRALGIDVEWVPGVPAFAAAAAALENELTIPGVGQSLLITRVSTLSTDMPTGEDLATLAATGVTLALHLAAHQAEQITAALTPHYGADCPTAVVAFASRSDQRIVRCALSDLPEALVSRGIRRTAVIFVGAVLAAADSPGRLDSYLYSAARMTKLRSDADGADPHP
ncbi:SAM-dependent methyltransferase [Gordonia sp. VNQ95]|jgi:precorrin-4/cobalt-precorrin-4 C11-methyltransferase|uniref:cobalt-precorrin-4/precorrin-4 C(11)-methyltransferase n=1 Tax=Gordonia TaxID=2053 RepID=UPI0032B61DA8